MTTELVLLLCIFAFLTGGIFFGEKGPIQTFNKSGPRLAARIEKHIAIGRDFKTGTSTTNEWQKPSGSAPNGKF